MVEAANSGEYHDIQRTVAVVPSSSRDTGNGTVVCNMCIIMIIIIYYDIIISLTVCIYKYYIYIYI